MATRRNCLSRAVILRSVQKICLKEEISTKRRSLPGNIVTFLINATLYQQYINYFEMWLVIYTCTNALPATFNLEVIDALFLPHGFRLI